MMPLFLSRLLLHSLNQLSKKQGKVNTVAALIMER